MKEKRNCHTIIPTCIKGLWEELVNIRALGNNLIWCMIGDSIL